MTIKILTPLLLAVLLAGPAAAQGIGGGSGGGGGIGGGGSGGSGPSLGGAGVSIDSSSGGVGAGPDPAASAGSSSIDSINVDDAARTGDFGAATTLGGSMGTGSDDFQSAAGSGPAELYNIPRPRVGVQLEQIRAALSAQPSATVKPDGS